MRGFILGSLTLIAIDILVAGPASERVSGVFGQVTKWLAEWMDPSIPLVPDHRAGSGGGGSKKGGGPTIGSELGGNILRELEGLIPGMGSVFP